MHLESFIWTKPNPPKDGDGKSRVLASSEKLRKGTVGGNLTNKEYFDELVSIASAVRTTVGALCTCSIDFSGYF